MKNFLGATLALTLLVCTSAVHAGTITITDVETNPGWGALDSVTLSGGLAGADGTYAAGQIVLTTNTGTLDVWCVDVFHIIYIGGNYTYASLPLTNDNSGISAATSNPLTTKQIQEISYLATVGNQLMASTPTAANAAAIQAAIWDVEYGTTATDNNPADAAAFTAAYDLLMAAAQTNTIDYGGYVINDQIGSGPGARYVNQTLFVDPALDPDPVPEPASLALFGVGVGGLIAFRRKRVR